MSDSTEVKKQRRRVAPITAGKLRVGDHFFLWNSNMDAERGYHSQATEYVVFGIEDGYSEYQRAWFHLVKVIGSTKTFVFSHGQQIALIIDKDEA